MYLIPLTHFPVHLLWILWTSRKRSWRMVLRPTCMTNVLKPQWSNSCPQRRWTRKAEMPTTGRWSYQFKQIMEYSSSQWPKRSWFPGRLRAYCPEKNELTIQQGLLMKGNHLVIPVSMWLYVLDRIHEAHQGTAKCRERDRAITSVWWQGLSRKL